MSHLSYTQEIDQEETPFSESFQTSIISQLEKEKERTHQMLDSVSKASAGNVVFTQEDVNVAHRIKRLENIVPLEYNAKVKAYLDVYTSRNYKPYIEKLLGLGEYYFPIYNEIFTQQGIPEEIRYLSVIESSLDPHTVSRAGAVGLWQFIYITAKVYDLSMGGHYDERKDVYSSTYAASSYLNEAYQEFDDWLLALASYNCGRGGVRRAIKRSGLKNPTYWQLSPYLPKETQNYIPKYIAMTYILNHAELYGLRPKPHDLQVEHRTLMVDRNVQFDRIAKALDCQEQLLSQLNPAYKNEAIDGTPQKHRRLVIPYEETMSDSALYAVLNDHVDTGLASADEHETTHRVVPGETLQSLAIEYGTTVQNILAWNDLKRNTPIAGRLLRVQQPRHTTSEQADSRSMVAATEAEEPGYLTYVVRKGDTLSGIANRHRGVSVRKLKSDNQLKNSRLRIGQTLKVHKGDS